VCLRKRGDRVAQGEALFEIHAQSEEAAAEAARELESAYVLAAEPPAASSVVIDVIA
jgi:thymidine phosphorylase